MELGGSIISRNSQLILRVSKLDATLRVKMVSDQILDTIMSWIFKCLTKIFIFTEDLL